MNPCEQKDNIETLYRLSSANKDKLHEMEVRQMEIAGNVSHIKSRIENGMSTTIHSMDEKLTLLLPKIEHHTKVIGKIEDIGWWISKGLLISLIGVLVWAASHGWRP